MSIKNDLLSIGEMAKLTGAGIQALRYYERKNILKPAYIDPYSGYRYYSFSQIYFVFMIKNCVGFGIPLKDLASANIVDDMTGLRDFFEQSKKAVEKRLKVLKIAAEGFDKALRKIELGKLYKTGQIHSRKFEEKNYYVKPCGHPLKEKSLLSVLFEMEFELYGKNNKNSASIDNFDDLAALPDIGCLSKHSPKGLSYYACIEMSKQFAGENTITIPAGTYFFRQDESSKIEDAHEIFKKQLAGRNTFMIIELEEAFLCKTKIGQPMYELRLIPL